MKLVLGVILSFWSMIASAVSPQSGLWWSPSESGRGYAIDTQGSLLVMTMFGYDDAGRMQWYYADGALQGGGARWSGTLLKLDSGQPLNGGYRPASIIGNDGAVTIEFFSKSTGRITLPGGRQVDIQRQNFGVGNAPQSLLGQWLFAYSIGTATFGDRYNYTSITSPTSTGNGVVIDSTRRGAAELQVSGFFAGKVVGFQFTSTGSVLNQYVWVQHLEEGRGSWVSPLTFTEYGMNAYKIATPGGIAKELDSAKEENLAAKDRMPQPKALSLDDLDALDPELGRIAREIWTGLPK